MARSDSRSQFSVPITGLEERVYDLSFRADVTNCWLSGFV